MSSRSRLAGVVIVFLTQESSGTIVIVVLLTQESSGTIVVVMVAVIG